MSPQKRALLLTNPRSRKGQQRPTETISQLQAWGLNLVEEPIDDPQNLPDLIRHYRDQVDLVIIGGGDGTLNAAVDGLIDTQLPLGILPLGTANDLARTLDIPFNLSDACEVIATGQVQRIDLGWINGKHFCNVASLGLSVQITKRLTKQVKRRWGIFAYAVTALQVLWEARPFRAEIRLNDESIQAKTIQIAVGNGRHYGGGMTIVHDADISDQRLDLYSLEIQHRWQLLLLLPMMWFGRHTTWPGVRVLHGTEFEVYTRKPRAINTDGEITTQTPAQFRVIPQALAVLVPREPSQ